MAGTKHVHAVSAEPVEGDGISYRGIAWFVIILVITTVVSELLMVGTFKWLDKDVKASDPPRAMLAAPAGQMPPAPNLMYQSTGTPESNEAGHLQQFHEQENTTLTTYGFDKASGVARIPIDKAKDLLLQKGLPSRDAAASAPAKAAPAPAKATKGP